MAGERIIMAELNLNQIIEKLNGEFTGDTRRLAFWYDDKEDFADRIRNTLALQIRRPMNCTNFFRNGCIWIFELF